MNLNNEISDIERYNSNVDEVNGWLDMTDNALDKVGTLSSEIKTLLTSISGTFGKDEMKAVSSEVNEKITETVRRLTNPLDNAINEKCSRIN